jgi:AcrR family transcriptional regulator
VTITPWGDSEGLHQRKLSPGPGMDQRAVLANQRERLMVATVAVVAERGYEATRVEDLLVMAGVSRNAFYKHFTSKLDCFLAMLTAFEGLAKPVLTDVVEHTPGTWEDRLAAMLDSLATVIVAQPAMARVGWIEYHAAGSEAIAVIERIDETVQDAVYRWLNDSPERDGVPREIIDAVVGGVRKIVQTRIHEGRAEELPGLMPELFQWMCGYHTPYEPLLRPTQIPPGLVVEQPLATDARGRIVDAVTELIAEKGYPDMAITEIAARASVSLTTFYQHFDGKEAAFREAFLIGQQRTWDATLTHFEAAPDWPSAVSIGARAFLAFLATHPAIAHLGNVGAFTTGAVGLDLRAETLERFGSLLDGGFREYPDTDPIVGEAIGATVDAMIFSWLRHEGAERLYEIAPTVVGIVLAPFVGNERACTLANAEPAAASAAARDVSGSG